MRLAHIVELDYVKNQLRIDGTVFPYFVEEGPEVEVLDHIGTVRVGILANNLSVITADGTKTHVKAPDYIETAWAAERGKEIVRDGLADVIAWIGQGNAA